ncbi:MAG: hypothetical protein KIPDCIKN_02261 [Haliscomenobacter sp.]|nr:hypothetical protein [Haliscomenobacter sp.]
MLFPIGDDNIKGGHYPLFSYGLIVVNVLIFVWQMNQGAYAEHFVYTFGAVPYEIVHGQDWYALFTSLFLHGGWAHIIGNMLFLWIFADNIEATIGNGRFLMFYLLAGLIAHAAHIFFNLDSQIPTIGASGAISGVMGAYMVLFPSSRVRVLLFIFPFYVPAILFLGFWIYFQFQSGLGELQAAPGESGGVAYWAHIGGFVFGVLAGFYYRRVRRGWSRG